MFFDQLFRQLWCHAFIPNAVGVNHHNRTTLALVVAMRLRDMDVLVQAFLFEFMFERCQHLVSATLPAGRTRAAKNVAGNMVVRMGHTISG